MYNAATETMPRPDLEKLQLERLHATLARLRAAVPPMADRLAGLPDPATLVDLPTLPFLRKADLREHYPFGLFAEPRERLARIHASSGTTGKPTVVGYTRHDLDVWAECMARVLVAGGARPGDMLHNAYGYGLFTGGLGLHQGAEAAGVAVVPVSGGNTERQVMLIEDFRPRLVCCTPSYALTLAEAFAARGHQPADLPIEVGYLGAEPWSEEMRAAIEAALGVRAINLYGLSEVIGPGVSGECERQDGLHIAEDHFLPEVVDADTGEPVPDGETGVLVLTSLTKEAFPVLRYWTGDLCSVTREPCACRRTTARMSRVTGRSDDMLVIRGVNVYPSQVEHALLGVAGLGPHFQLVVSREGTLDTLHVIAEAAPGGEATDQAARAEIAATVQGVLRSALGIGATVDVVLPGSVPRSEGGKLARVVDHRRL